MTCADWSAYLDELERCTTEQLERVALGELDGLADVWPDRPALGPLPACCRSRAEDVSSEVTALEGALGRARDATGRALQLHRRLVPATTGAGGAYCDGYG